MSASLKTRSWLLLSPFLCLMWQTARLSFAWLFILSHNNTRECRCSLCLSSCLLTQLACWIVIKHKLLLCIWWNCDSRRSTWSHLHSNVGINWQPYSYESIWNHRSVTGDKVVCVLGTEWKLSHTVLYCSFSTDINLCLRILQLRIQPRPSG